MSSQSLSYEDFLNSKKIVAECCGPEVQSSEINPLLYDFQRDLTVWAIRRGRAALFEDCGLGKTLQQLEWARIIGGKALIVAPLSVNEQTIREGRKIDIEVRPVRNAGELREGISITNYEMIEHFMGADLNGIVLDESSIIKSVDGATKKLLLEHFTHIPYRLCCTATPCPNDIAEIANHAEFLGVMKRNEMLASFFVHDQDGWRMRGHAAKAFYRWMASWAMAMKSPADLGYDASLFSLPPISINDVVVPTEWRKPGSLFAGGLHGITDRASVRKQSVFDRVGAVINLIQSKTLLYNIGHENNRKTETLQPQMAGISQGSREDLQTKDEGSQERPAQGIICAGRIPENKSEGLCSKMAKGKPCEKEATETKSSRDNAGNVSGDLGYPERTMRNMWVLEDGQSAILSSSGSLPQGQSSQGSSLRELQFCDRKYGGRSGHAQEGSSLPRKKWLIWCGLNSEQESLEQALNKAGISFSSIHGSTKSKDRIRLSHDWIYGDTCVMLTKPKVFGYGMNWQHCSDMVFMGLNDSWESYYQCIRRCWRYGQKSPVNVYVVVTDHEEEIVENVRHKEVEAEKLSSEIISASKEYEMEELGKIRTTEIMATAEYRGENWQLYQGDCVDGMRELPENSIDLSVFSPPFLALYTYSASDRDLGNSKDDRTFFDHFKFVVDEILRVTKPGRLCCVHAAQVATTLNTHGVIGMKDFRGTLCQEFVLRGWIYQGEVTIDKDPQAQAIRTHSKGLLFVQLKKDASWLRPAMADYILVFRKPGDNQVPIHPDIDNEEWIEWARPIWYGIKESDTLNRAEGRSDEDDRHICALQLGTIERCVRLWSNEGETVLSPFAGIGSEGYVALKFRRKFIGYELKPLYAKTAAKNMREAENHKQTNLLF